MWQKSVAVALRITERGDGVYRVRARTTKSHTHWTQKNVRELLPCICRIGLKPGRTPD
jgi:hypothetical protein